MKLSDYRRQYTRTPPDSQSQEMDWQILAASSDPVFHALCDQAIPGLVFDGKPVLAHHALTLEQAKAVFSAPCPIALVLIGIQSGRTGDLLDLIPWIRQDLGNRSMQIAVCTDTASSLPLADPPLFNQFLTCPDIRSLALLVQSALATAKGIMGLESELALRSGLEQEISEKEALINDLVETLGYTIWQTDRDGVFNYISANAPTIYGHNVDAFLGQSFDFTITRETRTGTWPEIAQAMSLGQPFTNIEISRTHQDGTPRYFLTTGRPTLTPTGEWEGFRGSEKEITALVHSEQEKKKLISQLRQAQRLEAMGTLAGGIAHDFNNILGGILGYTQLIQFEIKNNPVALTHTEHIIAGCNRAKNLILQILDFSRQREALSPPKITSPGEIVAEAVKLLRASIPSSIKLKTQIRKNAGLILADPSQIHQAVMNLCTNARQAIETGIGAITIQVAKACLTPENHKRSPKLDLDFGNYVIISVSDTGQGIESNTLEKIFNPYFTTKKRGDGTGLGLSVVHGIVTRFSGAIAIQTSPGQGSTFTLYFPRYEKGKLPEMEVRPRLMEGQSRVLFIDDEPMLVDIGRMMLEKLGYEVTALDTPLTGLQMIQEDPDRFDIVITDMTMPDILGTQLALKIKQINPGLPVVLATGFSNIVQSLKATPAFIDAVLPKPITMASLSQTLCQILNA